MFAPKSADAGGKHTASIGWFSSSGGFGAETISFSLKKRHVAFMAPQKNGENHNFKFTAVQ
jgi:hypothetical protein